MAQTFQARYVRNGRGAPSDVAPALVSQAGGSGKGDQAPLVFTARYFTDRNEGTPPSTTLVPPLRANARNNQTAPKVLATNVRRLTPTECERLQGFPDGWTAGQADAHRYRQMGNAVCVPVVEWIGRRAVAWLEGRRLEGRRLEALDG